MNTQNQSSFWLIMSAIFFGNFLAVLSITTINVTFPVVMDTFGAELSTVQWLMAGSILWLEINFYIEYPNRHFVHIYCG
ncbi:hypothetical protein [Paenibacillus sp. GCM10028914]|uniref:hypothetical protein n=1 Tax=Paenibacillus sp. GCM10028914 TaxID=3273416 RepID=UPI00360FA6EE